MTQLDGTPRMMREMAQQIRELVKEGFRPIAPRMRDLVNQLEQAADIEAAIARSGPILTAHGHGIGGLSASHAIASRTNAIAVVRS